MPVMDSLRHTHLVLFFTQGMSLQAWDRNGSFEREVALYRGLRPLLGGISFVTYGGRADLDYAARLPGISIICNRWDLSPARYANYVTKWLPLLWRFRRTVIKTNQIPGGDLALRAARRAGAPLLARCGYLYSEFFARQNGPGPAADEAEALEASVFRAAAAGIVTTAEMQASVTKRYGLPAFRVRVIPNYVDTAVFRPHAGHGASKRRVIYVGRLAEQKNLLALVDAMAGIEAELVMVGEGPLRGSIEARAAATGVTLRMLGLRPNQTLPELFADADVFVLPSHYEGHPKSLLEAMASGMAVLGSDAPGIRTVIRHGETGLLCGTDAPSIRDGLQQLLASPELRGKLGRAASQWIEATGSLSSVIRQEAALLQSLV